MRLGGGGVHCHAGTDPGLLERQLAADDSTAAWRRSAMPWKARFADDCVLQLSGSLSVTVAQAACAGRAHGQRDGDGSVDPGVTGSTVWDGAVVAAQARCAVVDSCLEH